MPHQGPMLTRKELLQEIDAHKMVAESQYAVIDKGQGRHDWKHDLQEAYRKVALWNDMENNLKELMTDGK